MTLRFSLPTLEKLTKGNPEYFLEALRLWNNKQLIPKSKYSKWKPLTLSGTSYLLNPEPLFDSKTDILFKLQYIRLAARRDFGMYRTQGIKYLDLVLYPDLDPSLIGGNPLLNISNNKLHFIFEEA